MKNKETVLAIIFGLITILSWVFPTADIKLKIAVTSIAVVAIGLIYFNDKLSYFFKQYWQEIVSVLLLAIFFLLFNNAYHDQLLPAFILLMTSISITLLISFKYKQGPIFKKRQLIRQIKFSDGWNINHWGSSCASIKDDQMIFTGLSAPQGTDGSHLDLWNILEIGNTYEIVCNAKSSTGTTGLFQLWCHDNTGEKIHGSNFATPYTTPTRGGDIVKLFFRAEYNTNIRIHLQYTPGQGEITVTDVRVYKMGN